MPDDLDLAGAAAAMLTALGIVFSSANAALSWCASKGLTDDYFRYSYHK